ncbi:MAG: DUF559 domain-containing protein [Mycobacterium sp.]
MAAPFLGAEALASGRINRHQLRHNYRRLFPGVYLDRHAEQTLELRAHAAWLWSRRRAVIAGQAAAAMLGARWVDRRAAIELYAANARPPRGIHTYQAGLPENETRVVRGMPVTSPARTAFDLARRGPLPVAVARVDALMSATGVKVADIEALAADHRGVRGLRQLDAVLALADAGAESPKETWLRLLLRRHGLEPQTQLEVFADGRFVARLDMGWAEFMVAVEYDGDHHRTDRRQYVRDVRRLEELERLGWIVVRVVAEDLEVQIVRRVQDALETASRLTAGRRT